MFGYIRVSTSEQADSEAGLEAQRTAITAECQRKGWELAAIFEDAGWSAKNLNRPGMIEAMTGLAAGQAGALVVAKLDRATRSNIDAATLLARAEREGWKFVALDLGIDTSTPSGELIASVMAAVAQWERRAIGARTREALAQKRAQGVRLGRPRVLPREVVQRIVLEREAGRTLQQIAAGLMADGIATGQGGASWWPATIAKVLRSNQRAA